MQKNYSPIIEEIRKQYSNFQALVLCDREGNVFACIGCDNYDKETIGIIISSTINIVESHLEDLKSKEWQQIIIKSKVNMVFLRFISENKVILVLANDSEKIEKLSEDLQKIASMLEGG